MDIPTEPIEETIDGRDNGHRLIREPMKLKGVLDGYEHFDVTPAIGREYPHASLKDWLRSPDSDDLIRDLAITSVCPKSRGLLSKLIVHSLSARSLLFQSTR